MNNSKIKCMVEDCKYCDNLTNTCILSSITINTYKEKDDCTKENTFCDSYKKMNLK